MAKLTRHRHGKHYTTKDLAQGNVQCGASGPADAPLWQHFSIRIASESADVHVLEVNREECQRIVGQLADYLARDTRKPMRINGSGHA